MGLVFRIPTAVGAAPCPSPSWGKLRQGGGKGFGFAALPGVREGSVQPLRHPTAPHGVVPQTCACFEALLRTEKTESSLFFSFLKEKMILLL